MNSRAKILNRLRKAKLDRKDIVLPEIKDTDIYNDVFDLKKELIGQFIGKITDLEGEVYKTGNISEAAQCLKNIIDDLPEQSVLIQSAPLINQILTEENEIIKYIDQAAQLSMSSIPFADYQAGITVADYLVARTGSIILNCKSAGGRRLSVLSPIHIVLAKTNQIIPSLDKALYLIKEKLQSYSYLTIITGASRTADIEKQLVLGAHGPKRLIVILIDD